MYHRTTCASWCTDHATSTHPDDAMCRRVAVGPYGSIYLSKDADGGPMVFAYGVHYDEFDLDQAEEFFRAGLALVRAGRSQVVAG